MMNENHWISLRCIRSLWKVHDYVIDPCRDVFTWGNMKMLLHCFYHFWQIWMTPFRLLKWYRVIWRVDGGGGRTHVWLCCQHCACWWPSASNCWNFCKYSGAQDKVPLHIHTRAGFWSVNFDDFSSLHVVVIPIVKSNKTKEYRLNIDCQHHYLHVFLCFWSGHVGHKLDLLMCDKLFRPIINHYWNFISNLFILLLIHPTTSPCIISDGQETKCCTIWTDRALYSKPDACINTHGLPKPWMTHYGLTRHSILGCLWTKHCGLMLYMPWPGQTLFVLWPGHALYPMIWPCVSFCGVAM